MKIYLLISLVIGLILQAYYSVTLPDTVANHFGSNGLPNGWMSNTASLITSSIVLIFNSAVFLSISSIFNNVPLKYISFPKKEYWLAPERKNASISMMTKWLLFFGLITNLFMIAIFHMVFIANQTTPPRLDEELFISLLIIYFIILIAWLVLLFKKFNNTH